MSTVTVLSRADLLREASLTICGRREGKTASCNSCLRKADAAVRLTRGPAQARDLMLRLADIICGSDGQPCGTCWDKATTLLLELRG
ncbi:hypothetical protein EF903_06895 [Streptomyces sp. WAC05292]|uniref:hypothetical protein n=1 Tax=Streptomyces sp. WAC05292 TaxID=2487418 RepID=UPI000F7357DE|nr:hypothetical protein [Streptomyces sp. WAC05292]RSS94259.1 hypothetical protein EF903_06895 [Streptomyces sp. WAC05292]